MIEGVWPLASTHALSRSFSTGTVLEEPKLWRSPNVCPTSWEDTKRISSPISSSSNNGLRAPGSMAPACTIYQLYNRLMTLWYQLICVSRISPLRGSCTWGPLAFGISEGLYTIAEWRASSRLHVGSSVGASFPRIAFLNPAFSKADCQSLTPWIK